MQAHRSRSLSTTPLNCLAQPSSLLFSAGFSVENGRLSYELMTPPTTLLSFQSYRCRHHKSHAYHDDCHSAGNSARFGCSRRDSPGARSRANTIRHKRWPLRCTLSLSVVFNSYHTGILAYPSVSISHVLQVYFVFDRSASTGDNFMKHMVPSFSPRPSLPHPRTPFITGPLSLLHPPTLLSFLLSSLFLRFPSPRVSFPPSSRLAGRTP
jgi:hypothetical protein